MKIAIKALATLLVSLLGLNTLADESKTYCTAELGQTTSTFREVFDGPSLRTAAGYKFTNKLGIEVAYEFSPGGTARENFWTDIGVPTGFDDVHMLSILGTVEWSISSKFSFLSKIGAARGTVDYRTLDSATSTNTGTLTETNLIIVLGVAVPIRESYDFTITVKEQMSANFFGLGDSFDSTTASVGLRVRF